MKLESGRWRIGFGVEGIETAREPIGCGEDGDEGALVVGGGLVLVVDGGEDAGFHAVKGAVKVGGGLSGAREIGDALGEAGDGASQFFVLVVHGLSVRFGREEGNRGRHYSQNLPHRHTDSEKVCPTVMLRYRHNRFGDSSK